mgnify:CR=1 FL=1
MGGQGDGASYTINLDTSAHTVEETAPGNYRIPTLSPTIDVPYAAVPTVMLTQASFTNTLTTISRSLYNNNTVDLQWNAYSGEFGGASLFATYYERLALSDGYYNSFALEVELAKTAYATNKDSYDKVGQGIYFQTFTHCSSRKLSTLVGPPRTTYCRCKAVRAPSWLADQSPFQVRKLRMFCPSTTVRKR